MNAAEPNANPAAVPAERGSAARVSPPAARAHGDGALPPVRARRGLRLMQRMQGRWRWAVLLAVVLATAGGAAGWSLAQPTWRAGATLQVQPMADAVTDATATATATQTDADPATLRARVEMLRQEAADAQRDVLSDDAVLRAALTDPEHAAAWGGATERPRTLEAYRRGLTLRVPEAGRGRVVLTYESGSRLSARAGVEAAGSAVREAFTRWQRPVAQRLATLGDPRDLAHRRRAAQARLADLEREAPLLDAAAEREAAELDAAARELADVELALTGAEAVEAVERGGVVRGVAGGVVGAVEALQQGAWSLVGGAQDANGPDIAPEDPPVAPDPDLDTLRVQRDRLLPLRDRLAKGVELFTQRRAELERVRATAADELAAREAAGS